MSKWWLGVIVAGTASAQPAKPPVACASLDIPLGLQVQQGKVLSCPYANTTCTAYSPTEKPIAAQGVRIVPPMVSEAEGKLSVCGDEHHCKPLGKRLAAAIRKEQADRPAEVLAFVATASLDVVIVRGDSAWSVPKDRALALRPPAEYQHVKLQPKLVQLDPVGAVIVATWANCEFGCARGVVVDATGANRGAAFPAGVATALGGDRIAIVATDIRPLLTIVAATSGKALATLVLGKAVVDEVEVVTVDDHTLAVAARVDDLHQLMWIDAPPDHPPTIGATTAVPVCK